MPEYKTPLRKRQANSDRWRKRYRQDPEFRLRMVNRQRLAAGLEPVTSLPPVGQVIRERAGHRYRDENGRWIRGGNNASE